MKVYRLFNANPDLFWSPYLPEGHGDTVMDLGHLSLLDKWQSWHLDVNTSGRRKPADFLPIKRGIITLSSKGYLALKELLESQQNVEVLPCTSDHGDIYIVNVWNKVDCFDRDNSIYKARRSGAIKTAEKYAFFESQLTGQNIFKFPEGLTAIFVSDTFVELAEKSDLVGLNVELVWSTTGSENQHDR